MSSPNVIRLKNIADYIFRGDAPTYVESDGIPVINQGCVWPEGLDLSKVKYHDPNEADRITSWIRKDDILVNSTGTGTLGRISIVDSQPTNRAFVDSHVTIVRDTYRRFYPKWLFYYLSVQQDLLTALCSEGATNQIELSRTRFAEFPLSLPSFSEQQEIAAYLDYETAKIDALIAAKVRLLTLLVEKRPALITHTITKGLEATASMRDSGVEWLGTIPSHWEVDFAGWLFREIDERSTTGEEELLTVSHITGVTPRSEKDVNMFMAESTEGYKICQPGDLVINTLWAWMGAMGVAFQKGIVSPAYNVYRSCGRLDPSYVDFLVRMPVFAQEVTRYSKGVWSSRLRLYPQEFFKVLLPVPPFKEQQGIAAYLAEETAKLDQLSAATQQTIELLRERRTALISTVVTGQSKI